MAELAQFVEEFEFFMGRWFKFRSGQHYFTRNFDENYLKWRQLAQFVEEFEFFKGRWLKSRSSHTTLQ
jgi:hypothetical protein